MFEVTNEDTRAKFHKITYVATICLIVVFILVILSVFVVVPLVFMLSLTVQEHLVFTRFGLPRSKSAFERDFPGVKNFYIPVNDIESNETINLGAWHLLPWSVLDEYTNSTSVIDYDELLANSSDNVIIHFHGTGETRLDSRNMFVILRFFFHVIAFDYRGYGDSSDGRMSERAVVDDCVQIYKWVQNRTNAKIYIWGHSLGASLALHTIALLTLDNTIPEGLVLESAFTTFREELPLHPYGQRTQRPRPEPRPEPHPYEQQYFQLPNYSPYYDLNGEYSTYNFPNDFPRDERPRHKNRRPYKGYTKVKYEHLDPVIVEEDNLYSDSLNGHLDNFKILEMKDPINFRTLKKINDMMQYYNKEQEKNLQKEMEVNKHQNINPYSWPKFENEEEDVTIQEESADSPIWQPPTINNFKVQWSPMSNFDLEGSSTKQTKNWYKPKSKNIEYIVDLTTPKPQIMPTVITERKPNKGLSNHKLINYNFEESLYPTHKPKDQIWLDDNSSSYEETDMVPSIISSFQSATPTMNSYSTLVGQIENDELSTRKKKNIHGGFGTRTKARRTNRPLDK